MIGAAYLIIVVLGLTAFAMAVITADWRFLLVCVAAYYLTVKT